MAIKKPESVFRPDDEQLQLLERWYAPKVSVKNEDSSDNAMGISPSRVAPANVAPEPELPTVEESTVTAQELEDIRQSAYDEGLTEGRQKGNEQGLLEGHEKGYEQGLAQGRDDGLQQGLAAAEEQVTALVTTLEAMLEQLQHPLKQLDERVEHELVELALLLARSVIHHEVDHHRQAVVMAVSEGIKALGAEGETIRVLLNPGDIEAVTQAWGDEELAKRQWTLVTEPAIDRGGCRIETAHSSVDMDLEQRINEVFDNFNAMPKPEPGGQDGNAS